MEYKIDATNKALGRIATEIASVLRGKNSPAYMPNKTPDVTVVVENFKQAKFTGNKLEGKLYHRYTGYHGGIRTRTLGERWEKDPEQLLRDIVYRMLPTNRTRDKIIQQIKFGN
ncbi:MAG: 50S ribosomal protein L13 [Candidatus Yanofskybacteria bacterium RIFCSPHIGHO2_02_FULL_50_12]|uniref:50S ribosomal protein L13 n=1 Tax=Candidatus Yanofskybacteria bacterium RIFCSPHIGHO2_02_FULL_50_12 TaxID=1802685 RepID=A0A1F8FUR1_9BACT|nr:MAG: 50S ribosomal protein L13 [Candidatus Yanofskybacteria bacterium RIFCSPHIGHO2_02_FULL_50_12]